MRTGGKWICHFILPGDRKLLRRRKLYKVREIDKHANSDTQIQASLISGLGAARDALKGSAERC